MAGLFDWLTDSFGGGGSAVPPWVATKEGLDRTVGTGVEPPVPMPMARPPGIDGPIPPSPPISGPQDHESMMPIGPPSPPPGGMPVPMPQPRPPGLGGDPASIPPSAAPTGGVGMPPPLSPADANGIVRSYEGAGGTAFAPPDKGNALTRALGLDANTARAVGGSLAAGLKSVGENAHKPGLAAFSGSAGSAMEGGQKADDKTTAEQDKYLARAIQAQHEGNHAAYQQNYLRYQIEHAKAKLEVEKQKAASGSNSVINSPEQLYLRAQGLVNGDPGVKLAKSNYDNALKNYDPGSPEVKAAAKAHSDLVEQKRNEHLTTLGVNPKTIKGLESKEGFSDKNPVKNFPKDPAAAQKAFDALPDGAYFINPKDGRLLTKKSAGGAAEPNPSQPAGSLMGPPMPMSPANAPEYAE